LQESVTLRTHQFKHPIALIFSYCMPDSHCKVFFDLQGVEKLYILAEKKIGFFTEADNIIHTFRYPTIDARVYEGNFSLL